MKATPAIPLTHVRMMEDVLQVVFGHTTHVPAQQAIPEGTAKITHAVFPPLAKMVDHVLHNVLRHTTLAPVVQAILERTARTTHAIIHPLARMVVPVHLTALTHTTPAPVVEVIPGETAKLTSVIKVIAGIMAARVPALVLGPTIDVPAAWLGALHLNVAPGRTDACKSLSSMPVG